MRLLAHPILVSLLAVAGATGAVVIGACANPDTQTPNCDDNVGPNGLYPDDNGCEGFAACSGTPASCCTNADGGALTGNDLATCLHGYGDPTCAYLLADVNGTNVSYTCSATPPVGTPDGG